MFLRLFLVVSFLLLSTSLFSQSKMSKNESKTNAQLIHELKDGRRIARNHLFQLFDYYNANDNDSLFSFSNKLIEIGIKQEDWLYINFGKSLSAAFYNNNENIEMALQLANESLNYFLNTNDYEMVSYTQNQIGISYIHAKKFDEARKWFKKSLESGEKTADFKENCSGLHNISEAYYREGKSEEAITYALKFLNTIKNTGNTTSIVRIYLALGNIYRDLNNIDKATYYYELANGYPLKSETAVTQGNILNNLAMIYFEQDPQKSKRYFQKSLEVRKTVNRASFIADSYLNLGHWHFMTGDLDSAEFYYKTMLTYSVQNNHMQGELEAYEALQNLHDANGDTKLSVTYAEKYKELKEKIAIKNAIVFEENTKQTSILLERENTLVKKLGDMKNVEPIHSELKLLRSIIFTILGIISCFGFVLLLRKRSGVKAIKKD